MINVSSGVINQDRFDVDVTDGVIGTAIQGKWVAPQAVGDVTKYDFAANAPVAFAIWTESNKDGTSGFTEDANYLKKVAVLSGIYVAETDQFDGTPAVGDKLKTTVTGTLAVAGGSDNAVAVVLNAPYTKSVMGTNVSVIRFKTL